MQDLREDLESIWRTAARIPSAGGAGRVIMFVSALNGEGTTSVASSFACVAARRSEKPAWLVDLDLAQNQVFRNFERRFARDIGRPGRAYDASLRQDPIYAISPQLADVKQNKLLTAHDVEGLPLLITRFRNERLTTGQTVSLRSSPGWWAALRRMTDWVIVDAPSLQRSSAAFGVLDEVDAIVLVVEADRTGPSDVDLARREIEARGGNIIGAVLNKMGHDALLAGRISA
jgi:Mrp family chromosome partitioning ATPase